MSVLQNTILQVITRIRLRKNTANTITENETLKFRNRLKYADSTFNCCTPCMAQFNAFSWHLKQTKDDETK